MPAPSSPPTNHRPQGHKRCGTRGGPGSASVGAATSVLSGEKKHNEGSAISTFSGFGPLFRLNSKEEEEDEGRPFSFSSPLGVSLTHRKGHPSSSLSIAPAVTGLSGSPWLRLPQGSSYILWSIEREHVQQAVRPRHPRVLDWSHIQFLGMKEVLYEYIDIGRIRGPSLVDSKEKQQKQIKTSSYPGGQGDLPIKIPPWSATSQT